MIILKPTIAFILILILTRILGKKQMSQMTFFNYVTGITIGSLAANIITFDDKTIIDEVIGLIWWCFLTGLLAFITLKSNNKYGLDMDWLNKKLKKQNYDNIEAVFYAEIQDDGSLYVVLKDNN